MLNSWRALTFDLALYTSKNEHVVAGMRLPPCIQSSVFPGFQSEGRDSKVIECEVIPERPRHAKQRHTTYVGRGPRAVSQL